MAPTSLFRLPQQVFRRTFRRQTRPARADIIGKLSAASESQDYSRRTNWQHQVCFVRAARGLQGRDL